jgi:hypothetical protein
MFSSQSFQGSIAVEAWKQPLAAAGPPAFSFGFSHSSSHNPPTFARAHHQAIQQGGFGGFAASTGIAGFSFSMAAQQTNSSPYASGQGNFGSTSASFGLASAVGQAFNGQPFGGQAFGSPAAGGAAFGGQGFSAQAAGGQPFGGQGTFIGGLTPPALARLEPDNFGRIAPQGDDSD